MRAGLPETVPGVPFQTVGGKSFLMFGMAPSEAQYPVYLYEELIEPKLGAGNHWPTLRSALICGSHVPHVSDRLPA